MRPFPAVYRRPASLRCGPSELPFAASAKIEGVGTHTTRTWPSFDDGRRITATGRSRVIGQKISQLRRGLRERSIFLAAQKVGFLGGQANFTNSDKLAGLKFSFKQVRICQNDAFALERLADRMNVAVARDC